MYEHSELTLFISLRTQTAALKPSQGWCLDLCAGDPTWTVIVDRVVPFHSRSVYEGRPSGGSFYCDIKQPAGLQFERQHSGAASPTRNITVTCW